MERILAQTSPDEEDIREALAWHKRLAQLSYLLSDTFPCLIGFIANPAMKATLEETLRYFRNEQGIATTIRSMVTDALEAAWAADRSVLLIGHSLGSVIAYDALWELSRRSGNVGRVDLFLTLGSPLGLNFVRKRVLGAGETGAMRYPDNIDRWVNLSAVGEMTALGRRFAHDFRPMQALGLVGSIEDRVDLVNYFRGPDGLNVHKCYGYMINPATATAIAGWWEQTAASADDDQ